MQTQNCNLSIAKHQNNEYSPLWSRDFNARLFVNDDELLRIIKRLPRLGKVSLPTCCYCTYDRAEIVEIRETGELILAVFSH